MDMTDQHPHKKPLYNPLTIFNITQDDARKMRKRFITSEIKRVEKEYQSQSNFLFRYPHKQTPLAETPEKGREAEWLYEKFWNHLCELEHNKLLLLARRLKNLKGSLFIGSERAEIDIDHIKTGVRLNTLMSYYGHHPKAATQRSSIYLCPFHQEKTPSFHVFQDNRFHCFGCQKQGSNIDFIMAVENLGFFEAAQHLNKIY